MADVANEPGLPDPVLPVQDLAGVLGCANSALPLSTLLPCHPCPQTISVEKIREIKSFTGRHKAHVPISSGRLEVLARGKTTE